MASWIAPALVAAVIAAFVSVAGWFVTAGLTLRADQRRREERVRDFCIALRADLRTEIAYLKILDMEVGLEIVRRRYEDEPNYRVFVPRLAESPITTAIVPDLAILSEALIDPVVAFLKQRQAVSSLIDDIRSFDIQRYGRNQEVELYANLIDLHFGLQETAREALDMLEQDRV